VIQSAVHGINELQVVSRIILNLLFSLIFHYKTDDNAASVKVHESFSVSPLPTDNLLMSLFK